MRYIRVPWKFSLAALARALTLTVTVYLSWIWTRHAYKCKVHNKASRRGAIVGTGPLVRRSTTPIFPFHCFKFTMLNLKNNRYIVMKSTKFIKMNLLNSSFSELFFTRACWRHSLCVYCVSYVVKHDWLFWWFSCRNIAHFVMLTK